MRIKRDVSLLILINADNKVLLQHRADNLERYPGYWGFFGGGIEEGETPEEGLVREMFEESGYKVNNQKLLFKKEFEHDNYYGIVHLYVSRYDGKQDFVISTESQAIGWFHFSELKDKKMHEEDYLYLERFNNNPELFNL